MFLINFHLNICGRAPCDGGGMGSWKCQCGSANGHPEVALLVEVAVHCTVSLLVHVNKHPLKSCQKAPNPINNLMMRQALPSSDAGGEGEEEGCPAFTIQ